MADFDGFYDFEGLARGYFGVAGGDLAEVVPLGGEVLAGGDVFEVIVVAIGAGDHVFAVG